MKKMLLYFTVLKYTPSQIRQESLNVGIAFHVPSLKIAKFTPIHNQKRLYAFDDEYDKDFFNMMMDSLSYEINYPVDDKFNYYSFGNDARFEFIDNPEYLDDKTQYFSNDFEFSAVQYISTDIDNYKNDMSDLQRTYLYYDRPKNERITTPEVKRLLSQQLRINKDLEYSADKVTVSDFSEKPMFDYEIHHTLLKALSFDYAHPSSISKELKSILYDLYQLSNNKVNRNIKLVINDNYEDNKLGQEVFNTFSKKINEIPDTNLKIEIIPVSKVRAFI